MDKNKPKVSVIIPTYNKAYLLKEAIESVLAQSYKDIEIIVVDDGSTDSTQEVVTSYGDRIKKYRTENNGNANARNFGVSEAKGKYVAFLDHDDLWYPQRLEKMIGFLADQEQYGAIFSEVEFIDEKFNTLSWSDYNKNFPEDGSAIAYMLKNLIGLFSNLIVKRELLELIGGLDNSLDTAADIDCFLRISVNSKIALYPEPLLKYRKVSTSLNHKLFTGERLKVITKFQKEYPIISKKNKNVISTTLSKIHLSYAEDLLWNRHLKLCREQIKESFKYKFSVRGIVLLIKSCVVLIIDSSNRTKI